jgi:Divergent InlB B-repeat domain
MKRIDAMTHGSRNIHLCPTKWLAAVLLLLFTTMAVQAQIDCGGEGQRLCNGNDSYFGVHYSDAKDGTYYDSNACDLGLYPDNAAGICTGFNANPTTGGIRHLYSSDNDGWIQFAMDEQRHGIQSDQAVNWISIFGTHNSYSNYQDGAFNNPALGTNLNVDQLYSVTDQLDMGARVIRLDPISYQVFADSELRMCHQSANTNEVGIETECNPNSWGRLFAYGLAEVRKWLDDNPGEVLVIRMYRTQDGDKDAIDQKLTEELESQGDLILPPPGSVLPDRWDPTRIGRWPTLRDMRNLNKRLIIFTDQGTNLTFPWSPWVISDGYSDSPYFSSCGNQIGQDVRIRASNKWSYIGEDRSGSNSSGLLGPGEVKDATYCGFGLVNVDFLMAGSYAASYCPWYAGGHCFYDYRFADPDIRRQSAIWSWKEGDFGDQGPAYLIGGKWDPRVNPFGGRWASKSDSTVMRFACAVGQANEKNPANYNWIVPVDYGAWSEGPRICQKYGGTFWAPQSALENQNLINSVIAQTPTESVWLNYRIGSVALEPLSRGITASYIKNFYTLNVTQGQSGSALTVTFQFTGGKGNTLSSTIPYAQLLDKVTLSPYTKTITLSTSLPGALDSNGNIALASGYYTTIFHVIENNGNAGMDDQHFQVQVHVSAAVNVNVDSNPAGQIIYVDGVAVTAPHLFAWVPGSRHTLNAGQIVNPVGERLAFLGWSNGVSTPSFSYLVPSADSDIKADFAQYYHLALTSSGAGTVSISPTSPDGYYLNGTTVTLTATADTNHYFSGFAGVISGDQTQLSFVLSRAISLQAKFSPDPPTTIGVGGAGIPLPATVDGVLVTVPGEFYWTPGSKHTVAFASPLSPQGGGVQFVFSKWSDGTTSASRTITAAVSAQTFTANFIKQYFVTVSINPQNGGTVPGQGWYTVGTNATFTATPAPRYVFVDFNANPALGSPLTVTINAPAIEYAEFVQSHSN